MKDRKLTIKEIIEKGKNVYLISDLHMGHQKLISNLRGFSSVEEHDNLIIENWNKTVSKRDIVWILGDLTMETSNYDFLKKLNGDISIVLGNHDLPQHTKELLKYTNRIGGMVRLRKYGVILSHCPIHESEIERFNLNIHGHVHANSLPDKRYFNVSCEAINYTPISISNIFKTLFPDEK
jgi:calcineurin-like phosphoesterase family protein